MTEAKETAGQIEYFSRAMKAPRIRDAAARGAAQARDNGRTYEEYLEQSCPGMSPPAKPPEPKPVPAQPGSLPQVAGGLQL